MRSFVFVWFQFASYFPFSFILLVWLNKKIKFQLFIIKVFLSDFVTNYEEFLKLMPHVPLRLTPQENA